MNHCKQCRRKLKLRNNWCLFAVSGLISISPALDVLSECRVVLRSKKHLQNFTGFRILICCWYLDQHDAQFLTMGRSLYLNCYYCHTKLKKKTDSINYIF